MKKLLSALLCLILLVGLLPMSAAPARAEDDAFGTGAMDRYSAGCPTITGQPTSVTVTSGAKATFTVTATGTGTLTYR